RRGLDSEAAGGKAFSGDLVANEGAARFAGLGASSSSVGTHADTHSERTAGHCLGEWITTRSLSVELRRASEDRVLAVAAPHRLSAKRVAGDVQEDGRGNREPDPASCRASWPAIPNATADDPSRSGAGHRTGDRGIPGRSEAVRGRQGSGQLRGAHPAGILQWRTAAARWSDQTRQSAVAVSLG